MSPEGTRVWRKTRRRALRGVPTGRHRAPQTKTETPMPASTAASLPQHDYRTTAELQQAALKPAFDPPADPYRQVQCTFCGAIGLAADMPDHGRGPRCYPDTEGCGHRWAAGKPVSLLPHGAEPLEPLPEPEPALPPAQEEALAAFESAHAEQDAAEGKDGSEDEAAAETGKAPGPPVSDQAVNETAEPAPAEGEPAPEPHEDTAPGQDAQGGDHI